MRKKLLGLLLSTGLILSFAAGCGQNKEAEPSSGQEQQPVQEMSVEQPEVVPVEEEKTEETAEAPQMQGDETFILYFSGIDVFGPVETKSRSDVNILAAVNRRTRKIQLVSTPRDSYVTIPGSGDAKDKLTHAGLYGIDCSIGALENLYGVDVNYYIRVNFSGYEDIIDKLGGIDVYSEYDFTVEPIKHYTQGMNHLSGIEALAFARERHAFAAGDYQRGKNQMEVVKALVNKMTSPEVLADFDNVMASFSDSFQTNMPQELISNLALMQLSDSREWQVETYYISGSSSKETTYSTPGTRVYVMHPDQTQVEVGAALLNDTLAE